MPDYAFLTNCGMFIVGWPVNTRILHSAFEMYGFTRYQLALGDKLL